MNDTQLLREIREAFRTIRKPSVMYKTTSEDTISDEMLMIQEDFSGIDRKDLTIEQASMMIIDSMLISDEAFCYFLPALAKFIEDERLNEFLFYRRLENIQLQILTQEQKIVVNNLITTLKAMETALALEEENDIQHAWLEWEKKRLTNGTLYDQFLLAITQGQLENVKKLLKKGININQKDENNNTPLSIAKMRHHIQIVHFLIQEGAKE